MFKSHLGKFKPRVDGIEESPTSSHTPGRDPAYVKGTGLTA